MVDAEDILRFIDGAMLADDACDYGAVRVSPRMEGDRFVLTRRISVPGVCDGVVIEISARLIEADASGANDPPREALISQETKR